MPESGEWFSPRTDPETLSSDDPPVRLEKPAEILPGPGSAVRRAVRPVYRGFVRLGRTVPPLGRIAATVPALRRRLGIDEPTGKQLVGIWSTAAAGVAAVGLAVAAVVGAAPTVVTQQFDRLSVLPGLPGDNEDRPAADDSHQPDTSGATVPDSRTGGSDTQRTSAETSGTDSGTGSDAYDSDFYVGGYSGVPGVPPGASLPPGVGSTTPPRSGSTASAAPRTTAPGGTGPTAPAPGGGTTSAAPPPVGTTTPPPPVETTTPPSPPVETTTPPPPPVETTTPPDGPTSQPPAADPPADPPVGEDPIDTPAPTVEAGDPSTPPTTP